MSEVNSSFSVASSISARLSQVASGFSSVHSVTSLASRTTVTGNTNAKKSISDLYDRGIRISNALAKDGNNINSVAKEFSKIDQNLQKGFEQTSFFDLGGF
ncbi:TIGR04197 family type VII secretion effector [Enterococcus sp. LJL51]|uniref:TIGR04197 family type VII secretion effector n=1 Tax=Enterococcus sp. LJL51 TaxID=3416656 RepID=UPI003CF3FB24